MTILKFISKLRLQKFSVFSIIFLSLLTIIYSPYFIINLPIFKIKKLDINTSPAGKKKTQEILKKDFDNSWLMLLLNREKFNRELEKVSNYAIKDAKIEILSYLKGKIKIIFSYRKPFALLERNNFLSYEGIIFSNSIFKKYYAPKLVINLKDYNYNIGDFFSAESLNLLKKNIKLLQANYVVVDKFNIYYHSNFITVKTPKGRKLDNMQQLLEKLKHFQRKIFVNLETYKFSLAKINRERSK
jgi:hypothetical protein